MTRALTIFLVLACSAGFAALGADDTPETVVVQVRMTKERLAECHRVSCGFLTPAEAQTIYQKGVDEGVKAFKEEGLDFHGCTKGDT